MSIEIESVINKKSFYFFDKTIKSNSSVDFNKINLLFNEGFFVSNGFSDEALDILNFDWNTPDRDRNWWWQIQALPFLNWFVNSFELQNDEQKIKYFQKCIEAIFCWVNYAKDNDESPLAWHDHAAAFRVRNIACWLVFCYYKKIPIENNEKIKVIFELIVDHLKWLRIEKNFSKHTNHGFDQAMISLAVCLMFDGDFFREIEIVNKVRLKEELNFAFTDEGVHKENSPGYQKMMLTRIKQLEALSKLGEQDIPSIANTYIEKAENFLRAITLPNGYLPMIGDTRGNDEGLFYQNIKSVDVIDYSDSGYVIFRGFDGLGKYFFLLLKNTHESNYHRHDDDMMIYIFYDGEVVLGDGGLYKYQEDDCKRKHLRSFFSHSVPYIRKDAIRNKDQLLEKPSITRHGDFKFFMQSTMFGLQMKRSVEVKFDKALSILISDSLEGNSQLPIWSNFFLEKKYPISISEDALEVKFPFFSVYFKYLKSSPVLFESGCSKGYVGSIISKTYAEVGDAFRFAVSSPHISIDFNILN